MESDINVGLVVFMALTLLLPGGLAIIVVRRKKWGYVILGIILVIVSIVPCLIAVPVCIWKFDALRGWNLCLSTEVPPYTVSLIQKPGDDFYESYLEVIRSDGKKGRVWIDGDDFRWLNPHIVLKDGKVYFCRGRGTIDGRTTYVDAARDVVFSGYYQRTYRLSELEFE